MKKSILILVFLVSSFITYAQQTKNVENLTSGKWKIETIEVENEVMSIENENHWMVFHADGLYEIYLGNEQQVGTWVYDEEKGLQFNKELIDMNSSINELNNKQLKFSISGYTLALSK